MSVVVPVRDRRVLLRACLDGLAAQTLHDHEVVVVDDGSRDGSGDEAAADAARGRPVRVVRLTSVGAVAARRAGVDVARAPLLAFTDSDCVPDPGWLAAGVGALEAGADVAQGTTRPARPPRPLERTVWARADDGLFATCNVFYRRAAYDAAGGFDGTAGDRLGFRPGSALRRLGFGEDTLLGWRVRRGGRMAAVPQAVVRHHVFEVDAVDALRRAWSTGAFPALVREVPELRSTLGPDLAAARRARLSLHVTALAAAARRPAPAAAAAGWWMYRRARHVAAAEPAWGRRVRVLALDVAVEAVTAGALLAGSARARVLVL